MLNRFRVEFKKHGIKYTPSYLSTIEGAVKKATSKGFDDSYDSWNNTPQHAMIFERDGDDWELIATVDSSGMRVLDSTQRTSVKRDENMILQAKNRITIAKLLQKELEMMSKKTERFANERH